MATMNRGATAVACVRALAEQSRPLDGVVVADNVSTDDTIAQLESLKHLPFVLTVHRMQANLGNAGGVEEAMTVAFSKGADVVWILDDDSWPRANALEHLLKPEWRQDVVRHAMQVDPETGLLTWPLPVESARGKWTLAWSLDDLPKQDQFRTRASWTGALIPKHIYEAVGPVNGELFIRGEDEEYPWRIEQAGFHFEAIRGAIMDHPGPRNIIHWQMFGRSLFLERGLADQKLYYKVRNMVWLKRLQTGSWESVLIAGAYFGGIVIVDGPGRVPLLWRAIHDGWRGQLGPMQK